MKNITLADGRIITVNCLSCSIVTGEVKPNGGTIYETKFFHAHQDVAYPIRGLVILASKRHVTCLDELTEEERNDYIHTLYQIRKAQREVLGIKHVYYFYNEDTTHHFHIWMVPRYDWMREFGRSIESVRPILLHARQNRNRTNEVEQTITAIHELKTFLSKLR
ncbi:diadenosine tetraphosphate (Ap4A) HIT family hydrolase [Croceifilum oryzae]|uniref:Diadenosine tetraphosphate (Ap4A) HIT family hydrolase n=1 Tax=Croceifilum oryzae TaxID=1553429 RepID=A0AAJ1WSY4_9BACL|nr:diadenosine tetraphosphate hydrolase [Croceifilum oryzae]MDQ0417463.1 diadenosine tetraphosphate (Ap4A) HIT family hydrolase [Croceifilum oryzae]